MKKTIYLSLCALFALMFFHSRAGAQSISNYQVWQDSACGLDMAYITLAGTITGTELQFYWGDGGADVVPVSSPYIYQHHNYASSGTYTVKVILRSTSGVRYDSVVFSNFYNYCQNMFIGGYFDDNSNGIYDAGDGQLYSSASIGVDSAGVRIDTIHSLYGYGYHAFGDPGTVYKFTLLSPPAGLVLNSPLSGVIYDTVRTWPDSIACKYFGFRCTTTTAADLAITANFSASITGAASHIWVTNSSCTPQPAVVTIYHSPKYSYYSSTATGVVSGNSVSFNIGSVYASHPVPFTVLWSQVGTLSIGDTVNTRFVVTPLVGDTDSTNNVVITCDTIRLSHDPNYKSVSPSGYITPGTRLTYTLAFENTGNDTARNIYILDTLSDNLDASSVKIGTSTDNVNLITLSYGTHTVLKFDFPNIYLPDSSHHGLCDGMVTFSVNARSSLVPGNKVDNRVGIYFDNNEVVMTNTVESRIPFITAVGNVFAAPVSVYPNPVSEELMVSTQQGAYRTAVVTNSIGQVLLTQPVTAAHTAINVHTLPSGLYYITLSGDNGNKTQKFEKR